jgi:hypothetical protein
MKMSSKLRICVLVSVANVIGSFWFANILMSKLLQKFNRPKTAFGFGFRFENTRQLFHGNILVANLVACSTM